MASSTVANAKHATLSSTTQDTVTITDPVTSVVVLNRSGAGPLSVRVGRSPVPSNITTLLEDDTEYVPAGGYVELVPTGNRGDATDVVVKIKGDGNAYSVIGVV
jgi:hypothetical protein